MESRSDNKTDSIQHRQHSTWYNEKTSVFGRKRIFYLDLNIILIFSISVVENKYSNIMRHFLEVLALLIHVKKFY